MVEPPERVSFTDGVMLTADDLRAEQAYHRRMRWLHNTLHGSGVVEGFEVSIDPDSGTLCISPGWAIDPTGREIILTEAVCIQGPTPGEGQDTAQQVVVEWHEEPAAMVDALDIPVPSRWLERPVLRVVPADDADARGVVLASVRLGEGGAPVIDPSVRSTLLRPVLGTAFVTRADG